jgi:hypothetical protein
MAEASVKKTLFCNFCKKSQHDVRKLIKGERWSHFLRQPVKVDSPIQRTNHHEDAETVFG